MKCIIVILILVMSIGIVNAGEIIKEDYTTVHIYGAVDASVEMLGTGDGKYNYNKTICHNSTVIEGYIHIRDSENYELEYTFIADLNDSTYISRILIIKQEIISSSLLWGRKVNRTLILDGNIIGNYEAKSFLWSSIKGNKVCFDLVENNIKFGNEIINNESLAFTQLNYLDQQIYLKDYATNFKPIKAPIKHYYKSVGLDSGEDGFKLTGLTGIFYNVFGDNILTEIPVVGNHIASFGKSIQGLLYLPLMVIQLSFNAIFTFLNLLINNMWYALLLFEIFCIIPSLKEKGYSDAISKYITTHINIFNFMYNTVVLQTIKLILRLVEIIRNMFRI